MDGVRIEKRSGLGNVLVATKPVKPGSTVIFEQPLLHVPQLKPSNPLYQPLQTYFEQHGIPASVVLKIIAGLTAHDATRAQVLQCCCPDPDAFAGATVVKQARLFAQMLLEHPPVPEFQEWVDAAVQKLPETWGASELLTRLWLIWVTNGHSFTGPNRSPGSALFKYGSKLTHTCSCPNTAYRTASGAAASAHALGAAGGGGGSSSGQLPPAAVVPPSADAAAAAAGYHVALRDIREGDVLTTNYLGVGHKRLLSTPMRQKLLQDKFLFKCTCSRCTEEVDKARGIPCPLCSGAFRAPDKLLTAELALPELPEMTQQPQQQQQQQQGEDKEEQKAEEKQEAAAKSAPGAAAAPASSAGAAQAAAPSTSSNRSNGQDADAAAAAQCGFVYCDMPRLLRGDEQPWQCDKCGSRFANDTSELWGKYYVRSHDHIESDMEAWVMRFDESLDSAPLIREPSALHERLLGIVRLLGPGHWAAWRLLLLGVELHCGVLEQAALQHKVSPAQPFTPAAPAAAQDSASDAGSAPSDQPHQQQPQQQQEEGPLLSPACQTAARVSDWVVRYCRQLWRHISHCYGTIEAGQLLGYHFSEAAQVLLQAASCPGLLPARQAECLLDQALLLQDLVLPGLRNMMGENYNPLKSLVTGAAAAAAVGEGAVAAAVGGEASTGAAAAGGDVPGGGGGSSGRYVAASVKRYMQQQAAEAARVQQLVAELKHLEAQEGP